MTHPQNQDTLPSRKTGRNIIAVASGKGGVGKTFLAITLAHALTLKGKKVLLFDGDFGLANIDIQLGLAPTHDIAGVLTGTVPMNAAVTHCAAIGCDVLAGRSGTGSLSSIPLSRLQLLRDDLLLLAAHYDTVIVDLGAGIEKTVRLFAGTAQNALVVCTDEPTALTDAYTFVKIMTETAPDTTLKVVINSADTLKEGERTYQTLHKACQNFLCTAPTLAGIIRRDTRVKEAVRTQTPLLTAFPESEAAKDILTLANTLVS